MGRILVECPACGACAVTESMSTDAPGWFGARRLTCTRCGLHRRWNERSITRRSSREAVDDYFGLPLHLRARCRRGMLWAFDQAHLDWLELFVAAPLRGRAQRIDGGWSNGSAASRMPAWIKAASSREDVLKAIATMRARLP